MKSVVWGITLWAILNFMIGDAHGRTLKVDPDHTIKLVGTVDSTMAALTTNIEQLSTQTDKIYLIIDSRGGEVASGFRIINAMKLAKARGVKFVCFVPTVAASMAMHILSECNIRYAFEYTLLLWHPMRIGGLFASFSADEMEYLIGVMRAWEVPLNNSLIDKLDIDKDVFYYHYSHETLFTTIQLQNISPKFIQVVDNIKGAEVFK